MSVVPSISILHKAKDSSAHRSFVKNVHSIIPRPLNRSHPMQLNAIPWILTVSADSAASVYVHEPSQNLSHAFIEDLDQKMALQTLRRTLHVSSPSSRDIYPPTSSCLTAPVRTGPISGAYDGVRFSSVTPSICVLKGSTSDASLIPLLCAPLSSSPVLCRV